MRCSRPNGSEQKERWGRFGPTPFGVGVHPPRRGAPELHSELDRVVRGAVFLAGGVLEGNLAHRRSVAVLCMLFKIKSNPIHPLSGALPLPHVPARVTRGAFVTHSIVCASSL